MQSVTSFPGRTLFLIGSVHSTSDCLASLGRIAPKVVFLETTQEVLGLLRRNEHHSPRLVDLPALLKFADSSAIDIRPVDVGMSELCSRIFEGLSGGHKLELWKFVSKRVLHTPFARLAFSRVLRNESSDYLQAYVHRWLISHALTRRTRECLAQGGTEDDARKIIEEAQSTSSFLASPDSDPEAFMELCKLTGIDERLQQFIIDFRNDYMCERIRRTLNTLPDGTVCAAVVGKNHVAGMFSNLSKGPDYVSRTPPSLPVHKSSFLDQILLASLLR